MRTALLLAGTATMTMGCLVTDKVEFKEPPNVPPVLTAPGENPPTEIVTFQLMGEAAGPNEERFELVISDVNVDQSLVLLPLLDSEIIEGSIIAPTNDQLRSTTFILGEPALRTLVAPGEDPVGCHKLEIRVSSAFRPGSREPIEEGDVDSIVWWLRVVNDDLGDLVPMRDCLGR